MTLSTAIMGDDTSWQQLTLETEAHSIEQMEQALLGAGAIAVTLRDAENQPVFEPRPGETPLWDRTMITGLFAADIDIEAVKKVVCHLLTSEPPSSCRIERLEDRDWERTWVDHFHPMRFGQRLWVCPTQQRPPVPAAINVLLDPGLAFGTGTHPTTALCLTWLDGAALVGKTVIDYGCGSGILALAAAKLGARQVWAVDIDPQALMATGQNAGANAVAGIIMLSTPAELPPVRSDVLLANILAGPLIELAPHFATLVRQHGELVLSGILVHQADAVKTAFGPWFEFGADLQQEEWILLQAVRKG